MVNKNRDNKFLVGWFLVVFLLIGGIALGFNKSTMGYFEGGMSGTLSAFDVYYFSNYPDGFENVDSVVDNQKSNYYKILGNSMFEVPDGYEFVCWNTMADGSGKNYVLDDVEKLTEKLNLYAQWKLIEVSIPDEKEIAYGDVDLNGEIDNDDYVLIEKHVNGEYLLIDDALVNADVNVDGKIDLVDVDIVKQVCLGNNRYVGYLPDNPIKIYDIYEGNIEVPDDSGNGSTGTDNGSDTGGSSSSDSNNGGGSSGSGNSSSGNGSGSSLQNGGSANNKGNGSSNKVDKDDDKNSDDIVTEVLPVIYRFKYINDEKEYANTKCEVISGNSCELVLPKSPSKNGYRFDGWNVDKNCLSNTMIKAPIMVSSNNTYYACFTVLEVNSSKKKSYVLFVVIGICLIAGRLIWYLIDNFRKNNVGA